MFFRILRVSVFLCHAFLYAVTDFDDADFDQCGIEGADFHVVVKNVGQGSCTILKNRKNSHYLIVDAGTSSDTPVDIVNRMASELGISESHTDLPSYAGKISIITSHSDRDHINLFPKLINLNAVLFNRTVKVFLGDLPENYNSKDGKDLLEKVLPLLDPSVPLFTTTYVEDQLLDEYFLGEEHFPQTHVSILCSNAGHDTSYHHNENTNSAVVRLCINGQNILIMGDASAFTTRRYMINPSHREELRDTQLLIESHHGASDKDGANDGLWLSQIRPKHVAISAGYFGGEDSGYFHPNTEPFMDLVMIDSLQQHSTDSFDYSDEHEIAIGIRNLSDIEHTKRQLASFFTYFRNASKPHWLIFQTNLSIYNTATSGDIRYIFRSDGSLTDFSREY